MLTLLLSVQNAFAQFPAKGVGYWGKEFSKEESLFNAKKFLTTDVLGESKDVTKFEIDALVAANSGELTTLAYRCGDKSKEGLILGFYGSSSGEAGAGGGSYSFKHLAYKDATELLTKIETALADYSKYLDKDHDNNNIYFSFDDLTILIFNQYTDTKLRIFWKEFDSEWLVNEFRKTKKKLLKTLQ